MAMCLGLEETELRLGLPDAGKNSGKRGSFPDPTIDLKLQLQTPALAPAAKEAAPPPGATGEKTKRPAEGGDGHEKPPAPKAQVVGWPPVRSFRKNILAVRPEKGAAKEDGGGGATSASFVKVSMDGAPYLRKVDLKVYGGYPELFTALKKMFISFGSCGNYGCEGILSGRDLMNESKVRDVLNGSEFVPTYEDKDGDWMLVGDVPWEMFVDSCKRLRIMKGSEAIGLAPRAMEKRKNRS